MEIIHPLTGYKNGKKDDTVTKIEIPSLGMKIAECEKHGKYESTGKLVCGIPVWTRCPQCEIEVESMESQKDNELNSEANLESKSVPERYRDSTLRNYVCDTQEQRNLVQLLASFIRGTIRKNLIIHGLRGTGKSHLVWAVTKAIPGARCYKMSAIIRRVKVTFGCAAAKETEDDILHELAHVSVLIIDEIGRQSGSNFEANFIFDLIDDRYNNKLRTVLVSNLPVSGDVSITSYIGAAAMERVSQNAIDIDCNWANWRDDHEENYECLAVM
jgi:DNA replication protein DnaC